MQYFETKRNQIKSNKKQNIIKEHYMSGKRCELSNETSISVERKIGLTVSFGFTLISKWLPFNVFTVSFIAAGFDGGIHECGIPEEKEEEKRRNPRKINPSAGSQEGKEDGSKKKKTPNAEGFRKR